MNLLIGHNGFIAQKLLSRKKYTTTSSSKNTKDSIFLDLNHIEDFDYTLLNDKTTIIFLAAISSPDKCKNEYENSYRVNVEGTEKFITKSLEKGSRVLFFSSDVVYGDQLEKVGEEDTTNPFGKYAQMKDLIEKKFSEEDNFKVFRLSYVLSSEDKYLQYLQSCIDNGTVAEIFHPFSRKVVYIKDLIDAIEAILERWDEFPYQKFNICGKSDVSRKDLAQWYNEGKGNRLKYKIIEPDASFWEARPKNINIISHYLNDLLGRESTSIPEAMKEITKE